LTGATGMSASATGAAGSTTGAAGSASSHVVGSGCAVAPKAAREVRWLWVLALGLAIRRSRRQEK
jgi:MYXO-CTERM domain-containing protein